MTRVQTRSTSVHYHLLDLMIEAIFIDLDGVMVDITHGMEKYFGIKHFNWDHPKCPKKYPVIGMGFDFYRRLKPWPASKSHIAAAALKCILEMDRPTNFLSACVQNSGCYAGKFEWLTTFLGSSSEAEQRLIICSSRNKKFLSGPNRVLIDDRQKNVTEWSNAGGHGILFHRSTGWPPIIERLEKIL